MRSRSIAASASSSAALASTSTRSSANLRRIIAVNRNLGFFTTGYNYMIQIIPALVVAPLFIRGDVEFGVITQSAMAFAHLLGAFSLIVTQFQAISSYGAVLARLNALAEVLQPPTDASGIDTTEDPERLAYERLTLAVPGDAGVLVRELSFAIPRGARVLVCSADTAVRARAHAGDGRRLGRRRRARRASAARAASPSSPNGPICRPARSAR